MNCPNLKLWLALLCILGQTCLIDHVSDKKCNFERESPCSLCSWANTNPENEPMFTIHSENPVVFASCFCKLLLHSHFHTYSSTIFFLTPSFWASGHFLLSFPPEEDGTVLVQCNHLAAVVVPVLTVYSAPRIIIQHQNVSSVMQEPQLFQPNGAPESSWFGSKVSWTMVAGPDMHCGFSNVFSAHY